MQKTTKNIDSIQRRDPVLLKQKSVRQTYTPRTEKTVYRHTIIAAEPQRNYSNLRKASFIASVFVASVAISIASQGFAFTRNEEGQEVETKQTIKAEQVAIPVGPVLPTQNISVVDTSSIPLPETQTSAQPEQETQTANTTNDPLQERKAFLKKYLQAKKSPLAPFADTLAEQEHWKLIVGIASAESSLCQKYPASTFNCWGVGGAWNLTRYEGFDDAIVRVNSLIDRKYFDLGLNTPKRMVKKWVGHPNDNWVAAVEREVTNLSATE